MLVLLNSLQLYLSSIVIETETTKQVVCTKYVGSGILSS